MDIEIVNKVLDLTAKYEKLKTFKNSLEKCKSVVIRNHNGGVLEISFSDKEGEETEKSKWTVNKSHLGGYDSALKIAKLTEWYYGAVIREVERDIEEINKQLLSL
jgi:hypothetical protein